MSFGESEIVRYSRQILLREVGGKGQAKLCASTWELEGHSAALNVAAAYLVAAGVSVTTSSQGAWGVRPGFLKATRPTDLNADLASAGAPFGRMVEFTESTALQRPGAHIVLAANGLAFSSGPVNAEDQSHLLAPLLSGPIDGRHLVTFGSAAALIAERLILGLEQGQGTVLWESGRLKLQQKQ